MLTASKQEIKNDPQVENEISDLQARRLTQMIAKLNISTAILWCKDLAFKSRKKDNEQFAEKCDQLVSDLTVSYAAFDDMEKELRSALQRAMDLEVQVIKYRTICEQQLTVIGNLEKELGF